MECGIKNATQRFLESYNIHDEFFKKECSENSDMLPLK